MSEVGRLYLCNPKGCAQRSYSYVAIRSLPLVRWRRLMTSTVLGAKVAGGGHVIGGTQCQGGVRPHWSCTYIYLFIYLFYLLKGYTHSVKYCFTIWPCLNNTIHAILSPIGTRRPDIYPCNLPSHWRTAPRTARTSRISYSRFGSDRPWRNSGRHTACSGLDPWLLQSWRHWRPAEERLAQEAGTKHAVLITLYNQS